jgi:hypothetical protein
VQLFDFTLASSSTVTFQTYGYGGGPNVHNTAIPPAGFESLLTWFAPDGSYINNSTTCGSGHSYQGACLDAFGQIALPAGSYVLALSQAGNNSNCPDGFPGDLGCGFSEQGLGNYTPGTTGDPGCNAFCGTFGTQETGNWAVDILNVTSATQVGASPEPSTWMLSVGGIVLLLAALRRRRNQSA